MTCLSEKKMDVCALFLFLNCSRSIEARVEDRYNTLGPLTYFSGGVPVELRLKLPRG
jgi:hypothetical protein